MLIKELLPKHRENNLTHDPEKLIFEGVAPKDVYNISSPFEFAGKTFILGRVESRDSEHSQACFFEAAGPARYVLNLEAPSFQLQDPFYTFIEDQLVVGGVEVREKTSNPSEFEWRTVFYKGTDVTNLERFFEGPFGMKDLRIKGLNDGRILVLTRPQGEKGGRGNIGAVLLDCLDQLTVTAVDEAPLLEGQFIDEEWGGANEIHQLADDRLGVLGHIACFDEAGDRHYYAMTFELSLPDFAIRDVKLVAERQDFLPGQAKRPDLEDVVFSGGILLNGQEATLYAGISDAEAQKLDLVNPFVKGV